MPRKASLGADLVIPALALGFAVYFFWSIADLGWEAKANGVLIGAVLVVLVLIQFARMAGQLARGTGDLNADPLWLPRDALGKRIGMVVIAVVFIAVLQWLGLTLALLFSMSPALWVMGVRKPWTIAGVSFAVAAAAYLLFIAVLDSAFPHGPVEQLLARLFA